MRRPYFPYLSMENNRVWAILKVKSNRAFESSFSAPHINSSSLMPAFYIEYNYPTI